MKTPLRILHLEDNPVDAELIHATLESEGIAFEAVTVETRSSFVDAIERGGSDLILADYSLPAFDGISALAIVQEKSPEIPFIFVSGSLGEEVAIETLKSGANDYVLKHRLGRLVPAVRRAIDEVAARKERKRLEDQLRHSQKMESIGTLAGGIAHDFNNLLTAIIGYSQLVLSRLPENDPLRRDIDEINNAGTRAAALTHQLLAFSRKQVLQPRVLNLNAVVGGIEKMLRRLIGEDVELVISLAADLGNVKADPGHIEQVIMNLAVNARDALAEGGALTIETANAELDSEYARQHVEVQPGTHVMLSVSDDGQGMDSETLSHVFEPFFTTKEQGKGTGLGLSTVYGIVRQSGGHITVYSEPGVGTSFKVYLPSLEQEAEATAADEQSNHLPRGTETVFLVEDDLLVRRFSARVLRELGYTVLEASNGEEALSFIREHEADKIDLMLTDVVMPQLGGKPLADRVRCSRPTLKVLFASGYTDQAVLNNKFIEENAPFLQKPFTPSSLARKVREVIDA